MKKCSLLFILFLAVVFCSSIYCSSAYAEGQKKQKAKDFFASYQCSSFSSERDFVEKAGLYCINTTHTKSCMKKAKAFFSQCRYSGDFASIAKNVQKKLLVMLVITKSADYAKSM